MQQDQSCLLELVHAILRWVETIVALYYMAELANKILHELNHLYLIAEEQLTLARHHAISIVSENLWKVCLTGS